MPAAAAAVPGAVQLSLIQVVCSGMHAVSSCYLAQRTLQSYSTTYGAVLGLALCLLVVGLFGLFGGGLGLLLAALVVIDLTFICRGPLLHWHFHSL